MRDGVRRSLSPQEHAIRAQFDAMRRDDARRGMVWKQLQESRGKGARQKERLLVKVHLQEGGPARVASCLIADLKFLEPEERPSVGAHPHRIDLHLRNLYALTPDRYICHSGDAQQAGTNRPIGDHRHIHQIDGF